MNHDQDMRGAGPNPNKGFAFTGAILCMAVQSLFGGPYSAAMDDPSNAFDAPVPGFTGPHGIGKARLFEGFDLETNEPLYQNPDNHVNPLFFSWAAAVADYQPSEAVTPGFSDSQYALGPVTGDHFDVVSLGDMDATAIANGDPPGTITLVMDKPVRDLSGADFVVFENGSITLFNQGGAGVGGIFGELAYVEVSADGEHFVRFAPQSLTSSAAGPYGSVDATKVLNLAGKHVNAYGDSWGTPFDLADVGLAEATHIRLVDVPGDGSFPDDEDRPIYDAWKTFASGGFDLDAVGAISSMMTFGDWPQLDRLDAGVRGAGDDPDGDGVPNLLEYAFARLPWQVDSAEGLPTFRLVADGGGVFPEFEFTRDERLSDLVYEVQVSSTLAANGWTAIARSVAGAPVVAVGGHAPAISEVSASSISSVGVIRRVTLRDSTPVAPGSKRFYRVEVSVSPPANP